VLEGTGGPDEFGYRFIDSDEENGPLFTWTDISSTGTIISELTSDDHTSDPIDLGFTFPFYGGQFDSVRVSTNGFLSFTSDSASYSNQPLPGNGPENLVAPLWDDLHFHGVARASYQRAQGRITIQYTNVPHIGGGGENKLLFFRQEFK